ncbi:MAG TPA: flagellar basal body L-ring protein FlgH [Candidatus Didemnitutus sp.]|nr:flagellar basal body L-ring protein FlgH [Candidatus Didemnitutus sp.]
MKTVSKSASEFAAIALIALALAPLTHAQSVWPIGGAGERSMFADRKASRNGDILTIVIGESVAASNTQSKSSTRESSLEDTVNRFLWSAAASNMGTHNGEFPATDIQGKANYSGGGQVNNTQSLSARAAVVVTDVLPNGNLVIEGARVVTFSGETQYVVLHGIVRPDDISSANTILSSNVADARVEFIAEGAITDAQKRGWLSKLYEKVRPF